MPPRYCEICQIVHEPPIHDLSRCAPGRSGRVTWTPIDPHHWPSHDEVEAEARYWDAVLTDKGLKPLS